MSKKSKLIIAALSLGCNIATAGDMGAACIAGNMTTPCEKSAWSFEAQAVYLQPSYPDLQSSFISKQYFNPGTTPQYLNAPSISPGWGWGFFLQGAYSFKNSKDLTLDWLRMHNTSSTTEIVNSFDGTFTNQYDTPASFNFSQQLDAVNAVLGQTFNFDNESSARLYGGVAYARLIKNTSNQYQDGSLYTNQTSSINGFGPRIGVDLFYEPHFFPSYIPLAKIYAKGATSILIGSQGTSWNNQGNLLKNVTTSLSTTTAVPALEAKLGVVGEIFEHIGISGLSYDLNYAIYNYIGGSKNLLPSSVATGSNTNTTSTGINFLSRGSSTVTYMGVQFGLRYVANV